MEQTTALLITLLGAVLVAAAVILPRRQAPDQPATAPRVPVAPAASAAAVAPAKSTAETVASPPAPPAPSKAPKRSLLGKIVLPFPMLRTDDLSRKAMKFTMTVFYYWIIAVVLDRVVSMFVMPQ